MGKQKRENYGTFVTKRPWYFKRRSITVAGVTAAVLILAITISVLLFNNDKQKNNLLVIPKASASDMPGWWYKDYFGSSVCEQDICKSEADPDDDSLSNAQEFYYHSNPLKKDTSGNGMTDGEMVAYGYDPSKPGKVTFEELLTDDSFMGESLVFDQDIKQMVSEVNDINQVKLPLVADSELQIINSKDPETYNAYAYSISQTISKYFPRQGLPQVKETLQSGSDYELGDIKVKSAMLVRELKETPVPVDLLMFHKYNVTLFQLLPQVLQSPSDLSSSAGDIWYDKAQAFFAIQQKLDLEHYRIKLLTE